MKQITDVTLANNHRHCVMSHVSHSDSTYQGPCNTILSEVFYVFSTQLEAGAEIGSDVANAGGED